MPKAVTYFFLLITSFCFSGELLQGTLSNGMRYYIATGYEEDDDFFRDEASIKLVIKKPAQWEFMDFGSVYGETIRYKTTYNSVSFSDHYIDLVDFKESLETFQRIAANKSLPDEEIEAMQIAYEDDFYESKNDSVIVPDPYAHKVMNLLFGSEINEQRHLFGQDKDEIKQTIKTLLQPCRMALIITGDCPQLTAEELESLFGNIQNEGFREALSPTFTDRIAIRCQIPDPGIISTSYRYYYQFAPNKNNYVLNDLFLIIGAFAAGFIEAPVQEQMPLGYVGTYWPPSWPSNNPVLFDVAKTILKNTYEHPGDIEKRCEQHFLSGISDPFDPTNQDLLNELEPLTQEDLQLFIDQHIGDLFEITPLQL